MKKTGNIKNLNSLADFIFEIGTLRNMRRMHTQVIPNSNDTIASHSFRTAMIGYLLADLEGADKNKVPLMALFHDIAETRTGDANFIHHFYIEQKEKQAYHDQTNNINNGDEINNLLNEFKEGKTKESIVAKDTDTLDQLFLEKEVLNEKPEDFAKWHEFSVKKLKTKSAKLLARSLKKRNPMQWFYNFDEGLKK
jgi:putative hydrolase of HD superfamily